MNETFKKINELANYVQKQVHEHRMPTLIIASPDIQNVEETTLCSTTGVGVDIVEMLATAFSGNDDLLRLTKDAIAFVEGGRVMSSLAKVRIKQLIEKEGCKEGCEGDCTEGMSSGEQHGPEQTCAMPESE